MSDYGTIRGWRAPPWSSSPCGLLSLDQGVRDYFLRLAITADGAS